MRVTCRKFHEAVPWGQPEALASFISRVTGMRRATRSRAMAYLIEEKVSSEIWVEPEAFALMHYAAEAHVVQSFIVQRVLLEEFDAELDEEVEPEECDENGDYMSCDGTALFGAAQLTRRPGIADRIPGLAGKRLLVGHLKKIRGYPLVIATVPEGRGQPWWMAPAIVYGKSLYVRGYSGFFPAHIKDHPYLPGIDDGSDDPDYVDTTANDEATKAATLRARIAASRPPYVVPDLATFGIGEMRRLIESAGLLHDDCLEKADLRARAGEAVVQMQLAADALDEEAVQEQLHSWRVAMEDGVAEDSIADESERDDELDEEEESTDADGDEEGTAAAEVALLADGEGDEDDENDGEEDVLDQDALRDHAHGAPAALRAAAYRVVRAAMARDAAAETANLASRSHQARSDGRDRFSSMGCAEILGVTLPFDGEEEGENSEEEEVEQTLGDSDGSLSEEDTNDMDDIQKSRDLSQYRMAIPAPNREFGARRHRRVLRDNIGGIGCSAIGRLAAHAGIEYGEEVSELAAPIFEEMRHTMDTYLKALASDAIDYASSAGEARALLEGDPHPSDRASFDRVMLMDVVFALKRSAIHTMMHAFPSDHLLNLGGASTVPLPPRRPPRPAPPFMNG